MTLPIVFFACFTGAIIAFLLSRYLFKDFVKKQINNSEWLRDNFQIFDEVLRDDGIKIVALMRLSFLPLGISSYILGVSSIRFRDYAIGNLSYIIMVCNPCFIGCFLSNHTTNNATKLTFLVQIFISILVTAMGGKAAKSILSTKMEENR